MLNYKSRGVPSGIDENRRSARTAIALFVMGIVLLLEGLCGSGAQPKPGWFWPGWIAGAIILGIIAMVALVKAESNQLQSRQRRGLSVLSSAALILIVVGFVLAASEVVGQGMGRTMQTVCQVNMRAISAAVSVYADRHSGQFPASLQELVRNDALEVRYLICHASEDERIIDPANDSEKDTLIQNWRSSYIYTGVGLTLQSPRNCVVVYEKAANHWDQHNVLLADGTILTLPSDVTNKVVAELNAGANPPPSLAATTQPAN